MLPRDVGFGRNTGRNVYCVFSGPTDWIQRYIRPCYITSYNRPYYVHDNRPTRLRDYSFDNTHGDILAMTAIIKNILVIMFTISECLDTLIKPSLYSMFYCPVGASGLLAAAASVVKTGEPLRASGMFHWPRQMYHLQRN